MTQSSRPQAGNKDLLIGNPDYVDAGPWSRDEWAFRMRAAHTGDLNTPGERGLIRGVIPTYESMLAPRFAATDLLVARGAGMAQGSYLFSDAVVTFEVDTDAPLVNPRIDILCIVENNTNLAVNDGTEAQGWIFPNDLTDYNTILFPTGGIPPYSARLVIVKGTEAAAPVVPILDASNTLFMIPLYQYQASAAPVPVISAEVDRREYADIEVVLNAIATENGEIHEAAIWAVGVNNGLGEAGLGVGVRAQLENDAGDIENAGQAAFVWTDPADGAEDAGFELRLSAGGADNLSAVINAPAAASADGNARGAGAVDLQQNRQVVTEVASGDYAFLAAGVENTASGDYAAAVAGAENVASGIAAFAAGGFLNAVSGDYAHASGYDNEASGDSSHAEGRGCQASADYAHAEGFQTTASAVYSHAEGINTVASFGGAHAEGNATTASQGAAHAEGSNTVASATSSHAEGLNSVASQGAAHAEGDDTEASGTAAHAEGSNTVASGDAAYAGGVWAVASQRAQFSRSTSRIAAAGDAQYSDFHLQRAVTHSDAAWYALYAGSSFLERLVVSADRVMTFDCLLVGTTQGCTKSFSYRIVGIIENDGGATTLLASTVTTIFEDDADFNARASADDPNDALLIEVTDATSGGDVVRWSAVVRTAEVSFPA